ncbi:hypothetical protein DAMA08_046150 [Martiniozyma asiatica (nom. inval.)]|nr:hypothetical protein DAMA08_046150 [Martiniozyma asiatica]
MPFRYPHKQTMALVKQDMNHWGIIDHEYTYFMKEKRRIFSDYNAKALSDHPFFKILQHDDPQVAASINDAITEFRDFVVSHYSARYPHLFIKSKDTFYNLPMNETYDLKTMHPLEVVTRISMEDHYIVLPLEQGHTCVAVTVAFGGGGFPIAPVVGQVLDTIHTNVPYYESHLKKSMNKWFTKFTDPVERAAWHIVWDRDLACSEIYTKSREIGHDLQDYVKTIPYDEFLVRIDKQGLIKLEKSKAVIFNNHPVYLSLDKEIRYEPGAPSIILKVMYESPEDIIKHRHFESFRDYLKPYLEEMIQEQVKNEVIKIDDKVKTLPNYPFAYWMNDLSNWSKESGWTRPSA